MMLIFSFKQITISEGRVRDGPLAGEVQANYCSRQNVCKLRTLLDQAAEVIGVRRVGSVASALGLTGRLVGEGAGCRAPVARRSPPQCFPLVQAEGSAPTDNGPC